MTGWRWLMRATIWARRPPSMARVKFFGAILLVCLLIGFVEYFLGWPDWATAERVPRFPR